MGSYAVRAAVLQAMSERGLHYLTLANKLRWPPDRLVIRLGERTPLSGTEVRQLGLALGVDLRQAARQPAKVI